MQRSSLCLLICMLIPFPLKQSTSQYTGKGVLLSMVEEIMTPLIFICNIIIFLKTTVTNVKQQEKKKEKINGHCGAIYLSDHQILISSLCQKNLTEDTKKYYVFGHSYPWQIGIKHVGVWKGVYFVSEHLVLVLTQI